MGTNQHNTTGWVNLKIYNEEKKESYSYLKDALDVDLVGVGDDDKHPTLGVKQLARLDHLVVQGDFCQRLTNLVASPALLVILLETLISIAS